MTIHLDWIGFGWCACQSMNSAASGHTVGAVVTGVLALICLAYGIRNEKKAAGMQ